MWWDCDGYVRGHGTSAILTRRFGVWEEYGAVGGRLDTLLTTILYTNTLTNYNTGDGSTGTTADNTRSAIALTIIDPIANSDTRCNVRFGINTRVTTSGVGRTNNVGNGRIILGDFSSGGSTGRTTRITHLVYRSGAVLTAVNSFSDAYYVTATPVCRRGGAIRVSPSTNLVSFPHMNPCGFTAANMRRGSNNFLVGHIVGRGVNTGSITVICAGGSCNLGVLDCVARRTRTSNIIVASARTITSNRGSFATVISGVHRARPRTITVINDCGRMTGYIGRVHRMN